MNKQNIKSLLEKGSLLAAVKGSLLTETEIYFTSVSIDSRNVKKNSLFVPLMGEKQNGHDYIPSALKNGASVVFVDSKDFESRKDFYYNLQAEYSETSFIIVNNTLSALQAAAAKYVSLFPDLVKIGVTGSSGKTTTKEILVAILSQKFNVISNVGNFNSETGLPLSVFNIRSEHEVGVFEMGMNRVNEIGELAEVLKPKYGIITNIGTAHIGILGSRQGIACEKKKIFSKFTGNSCVGFVPADDDFCDYLMADVNGTVKKYSKEACGVSNVEDIGLDGTKFLLGTESVVLKLPGKYNLKNTLSAILLSKELGLSDKEIKSGIENVKPMFGRSQILKGKYVIIQDCYNANPDSMESAIDFCSSIKYPGKKIFILGDMLELGADSVNAHENVGLQSAKSTADYLFFMGNEVQYSYKKCCEFREDKDSVFYIKGKSLDSVSEIVSKIKSIADDGDLILLKASRGMGLERITEALSGEV